MPVKIVTFDSLDRGTCFEITIAFKVLSAEEYNFEKFSKWQKIRYIKDPEAYQKELDNLIPKFTPVPGENYDRLEFIGPRTQSYEQGYIPGYDCIEKRDGVFTFHEYITKTPVTLAIVEEMKRFQTNSSHTADSPFATESTYYFATLLECLFYHWD
jgi:hypothetical protein